MHYSRLAQLYEDISSTTKRLEKTAILAKFLEHLEPKNKEILYLLTGNIFPDYDDRKIGISEQLAIKAISKATGENKEKIIKEWKRIGDLGEVAEHLAKSKKQSNLLGSKTLTAEKVLENLRKLPALEGKGTVDKKMSLITELFISTSALEAKYLTRTLIGDLRIGIQESTIRDGLVEAFFSKEDKKEAQKKVQEALDKSNDVAEVFEKCLKKDFKELAKISLEVGKPIKVMLAEKASNIKGGFETVGKPAAIEYKYDGFRLLIHKNKDKIILYTRRLENVTKQFPEIVEYVKKYVKGESFILDSEAVGFNKKTKVYQPFQAVSQRIKRKYDIEKLQDELPVEVNVFDILYYNGKSMIDTPFAKRSEFLRKIVKNTPYKIIASKQIITSDEEKAEKFFKQALKDKQEGVMMKNLEAGYQPGRRVGHMLKIKPSEKDFDLVITGAEYGKGKRVGWMTSFIISCYDEENEKYVEIGKVGTGILEKKEDARNLRAGGGEDHSERTEKTSFGELTELLKPIIIHEKGKDVSVKPKIIVAITYQEIQKSPTYSSGFALRFPRVLALRNDKPLKEITTLKEIEKAFEHQKRNWEYG